MKISASKYAFSRVILALAVSFHVAGADLKQFGRSVLDQAARETEKRVKDKVSSPQPSKRAKSSPATSTSSSTGSPVGTTKAVSWFLETKLLQVRQEGSQPAAFGTDPRGRGIYFGTFKDGVVSLNFVPWTTHAPTGSRPRRAVPGARAMSNFELVMSAALLSQTFPGESLSSFYSSAFANDVYAAAFRDNPEKRLETMIETTILTEIAALNANDEFSRRDAEKRLKPEVTRVLTDAFSAAKNIKHVRFVREGVPGEYNSEKAAFPVPLESDVFVGETGLSSLLVPVPESTARKFQDNNNAHPKLRKSFALLFDGAPYAPSTQPVIRIRVSSIRAYLVLYEWTDAHGGAAPVLNISDLFDAGQVPLN